MLKGSIRAQMLPYAIVVLFGYIGFSLPLPVLPEMFLDPTSSLLPSSYSIELKTIIMGLMMTGYPLGQLIGCPILGNLSDRYGRKKIILYSLCGTTLGYIITALAVMNKEMSAIFFGLMLCGFSEGNVAIAQAVIADIAPDDSKASHFGWVNLFATFGFIIGPLLGGQLADSHLVSWFTFATPFWAAALMTLCGIGIILLFSNETRKRSEEKKLGLFSGQWMILKMPKIKPLFLANFLLALGYFSFFRFMPVFLEREFNFSTSQLAYVMVYDSLAFAFALLCLVAFLGRHLSVARICSFASLILGLMLVLVVLPSSPYALFATIPPIGIAIALSMTHGSVLVSNATQKQYQGLAMGTLQSVQVFAETLIGLVGGILAAYLPAAPLFLGALMAWGCAFILLRKF